MDSNPEIEMSRKRPRSAPEQGPSPDSAGRRGSSARGGFSAFSQRADGKAATVEWPANGSEVIAGKNITAREARIMLSAEGGELTWREMTIEVLWAVAMSASLAWAIAVGKATLWHLLLPMAGEMIAYLAALPFLSLLYRHPEIRKAALPCLRTLLILCAAAVVAVVVRARQAGTPFVAQWNGDTALVWNWIFSTQMHWPILIASLHMIRTATRSARLLVKLGPPFLGPGMGCGMRIAVLVLAAVIVPAFGMVLLGVAQDVAGSWIKPVKEISATVALAWALWGCLLATDILMVWFRWDLQSKLRQRGYTVPGPRHGEV